MTGTSTLRSRAEIDDKYKWNAPSVFADLKAWDAEIRAVEALLPNLKSYAGRLAEGPGVLADFLSAREEAARRLGTVGFYARMQTEVDANDSQASLMRGRAESLGSNFAASVAFLNPELIAIGHDTLKTWLQTEPRLKDYAQVFDDLFRQQTHVRSAEVEEVLGLVNAPFGAAYDAYGKLTNADMRFKDASDSSGKSHTVSQSTIRTLYQSTDRELRRSAYDSFMGKHLEMKNTLASLYLGSVRQDVFNMRVRNFESSLDVALFNYNIPRAVFDNLIATFQKNLPTWHKYWDVRRRALNQADIQPYDVWAPIASDQPYVSYEQAVEWICAGMAPLGSDYVEAVRKGCLEERWVDVYPNVGKRQGAFSSGTYDTYPFIMMSFDDSLQGMSTLAHELGHSMHKVLSKQKQPWPIHMYTLFAAEVASNFNQALTREYLRKAKKDDALFQIVLIEEAMSNFHRYFFVMPTLARFELEVHTRVEQGQGLTADDLISICADLFAEGYGEGMQFDRDKVGITWATFLHLYRAYYTYTYATGISAAHELARGITQGGEAEVARYLDFLSAGGSMYPIDALKHAGVDMTQPNAVETTFAIMGDMVDQLETLVG